jgi:hypothetical protein
MGHLTYKIVILDRNLSFDVKIISFEVKLCHANYVVSCQIMSVDVKYVIFLMSHLENDLLNAKFQFLFCVHNRVGSVH